MNGDRFHEGDGGRERHRDAYRDDRRDRDRDRGGRRDRDRDRERGERGDRGDRGGDRGERGGDRRDRRRSRSPHGRHEEVDSYSRSRDFRAREREDRYSNRRDDRGWDRDRGDRDGNRDRRRRDDDDRRGGGGRRERDLFDRGGPPGGGGGGMGGGGGGGGRGGERGPDGGREARRDRDEFAMQARSRKSPTPPPRNREPTPDLTDVVSVLERKRRLTQWDIKPPGYDNVTAEQAKLSGMFPLPGAPRQQVMDPTKLQSLMNASGGGAEKAALKPSNSRQAKRLVVSNLPPSVAETALVNFFNLQMNGLNIVESTDPCASCQLSEDRGFAMLEFKTPSDATLAMAFDGTSLDDNPEDGLVIRRPKDYIVAAVTDEEQLPGGDIVSTNVPDTANKISISNILPSLTEEQVKELLTTFGALRSFVLVRERGNDVESRGLAFCEYVDPAVTEVAVEGLNGMELGPQKLRVRRASSGEGGAAQADSMEMSVNAMSLLAATTADNLDETRARVLQLLNMVTADELMDQQDYDEIVEDVSDECAKYGALLAIKVPRPSMAGRQSAGVGKIYVKYDTPENAKKAMAALAGRKFADRTVVVTYFSEENFDTNAW